MYGEKQIVEFHIVILEHMHILVMLWDSTFVDFLAIAIIIRQALNSHRLQRLPA